MEFTRKRTTTGARYCSASGCRNNTNNRKGLSFFRFPADQERCTAWLKNCDRYDLMEQPSEELNKRRVLCSSHFTAKSFLNDSDLNRRLTWNAVPTIFNGPFDIKSKNTNESVYYIVTDDLDTPDADDSRHNGPGSITLDASNFTLDSINMSLDPTTYSFDSVSLNSIMPSTETVNPIKVIPDSFGCLKTKKETEAIMEDLEPSYDEDVTHSPIIRNKSTGANRQPQKRDTYSPIEMTYSPIQTEGLMEVEDIYHELAATPPFDWSILLKKRMLRLIKHTSNYKEVFFMVEIDPSLSVTVYVKGEPLEFNHSIQANVPQSPASLSEISRLLTHLDSWRLCLGNFELRYQDCPHDIEDCRYEEKTRSFHHLHCEVIVVNDQQCSYCHTIRRKLDCMLVQWIPKVKRTRESRIKEVLDIQQQIKKLKEEKLARDAQQVEDIVDPKHFSDTLKTY